MRVRKRAKRIQNVVKKYGSPSAYYTIRKYNVDVMKSLTTIDANIHHQLLEGGTPVEGSSTDGTLSSIDSCIHLTCIIYGSRALQTKYPTTVDIAYCLWD